MSKEIRSDLDFLNTSKPVNVPNPTNAQDVATKAYVDSAVEGTNWKDSVRVATSANINLAAPGANVDGIAMAVNDRFLPMGQTAPAENGIYVWNGAATPATRALDMNAAAEVEQAIAAIEEGTFAGTSYRQTAVNVNLGVTALPWTLFGGSSPPASEAAAGVTEKATQAETNAGTAGNLFVPPEYLANWTGKHNGFAQTIGDAAATSFNIDHGLNSFDVQVEVVKTGGNRDTILCDVQRTTVNRVVVVASPAPALNSLRVLVTKVV